MTISLIGGGASSVSQSANLQQSTINQEEFLKILMTQLQFQDPLKPMDNQEFLAQMAQFSSLAQTAQINDRIDTLLSLQAANQSIGLIGKNVQVNRNGVPSVGVVTSIQFSEGEPSLTVTINSNNIMTGVKVSEITVVRGE